MPRQPRLDLPGLPVHVTQRGVNRCAIFLDDDDRHHYRRLLRKKGTEVIKFRLSGLFFALSKFFDYCSGVSSSSSKSQNLITSVPLSSGSGRDMFIGAMRRLEADGVQVNGIRGYWMEGTDSVNFAQYSQNLSSMSSQQAAASTWTGQIASDFGYTVVSPPKDIFGNITVIFTKPRR